MKITFYVDILSPFGYVAYYVLRHDPVFKNCEITYIPVFLGGIMKMAGNTAPIFIKNKDKYTNQERVRWARYFNVPIVPEVPTGFPYRTLSVQRALCAIAHLTGEAQTSPTAQRAIIPAIDALYEAYWAQGRNVAEEDVLRDVISGLAGTDVAKVLEVAGGEGKAMLTANTALAFGDGAFGLPWIVCENEKGEKEGFWGVDHLGCVLDFLGLEKPRAGGWRALL
ncbi:HCCA isomerase/glutathione S-transferase kappa [Cryphonectria parasitica EP155]|uniref:Glutathione S-transferase kappa n=1 Tax=Cryphonectria parasitica (strain ATCC 38755 / EP155) TaxID=660469 RepID=A0A9P4Y545_CRYP1|nr:HCCA isomerase/glutathione S-transferase kappa [Cryphonectria parasitica EP155]KAF3766527.1 HCCA isomerase/glutathione S-transferase kappa [Cryphonectria parasitica EP155]